MKHPVTETLIAGLWVASAIEMAAYTWESFSYAGGWGAFPSVGGGTIAHSPIAASASAIGGILTAPVKAITGAVNNPVGALAPTSSNNPITGIPIRVISGGVKLVTSIFK